MFSDPEFPAWQSVCMFPTVKVEKARSSAKALQIRSNASSQVLDGPTLQVCCCSRSWLSGGCRCPGAIWCLASPGSSLRACASPALQSAASRKKVLTVILLQSVNFPGDLTFSTLLHPQIPGSQAWPQPIQPKTSSHPVASCRPTIFLSSDHQLQVRRRRHVPHQPLVAVGSPRSKVSNPHLVCPRAGRHSFPLADNKKN